MKLVLLQFDSILMLAGFSKLVTDRSYLIIIKELTLQTTLNENELQLAFEQYKARLAPFTKAAA